MTDPDTSVDELMISPVETGAPDATLSEVSRRLYEANISSLVVGDDPLTGIVTESDVVTYWTARSQPQT